MRFIGKVLSVERQLEHADVQFEDDTHTYTYAVGKGFYKEHYLDQYFIVKPFLDSYEGKKFPIFNTLYCFDNKYGQSYITCVNQALYFEDEEVALMSTFQARASGSVVRNIPKHFEKNSPLSISFPDQDLSITFSINGMTCYISLQIPTEVEVNSLPRLN